MPHLHSHFARLRRLGRAVARGCIKRKALAGACLHADARSTMMTTIVVPRSVAHRVAAFAASIALHAYHCWLLKQEIHFAGIAAARAKPSIGNQDYNLARAIHRNANSGKPDGFLEDCLAVYGFW
jgi:hypothetical protein